MGRGKSLFLLGTVSLLCTLMHPSDFQETKEKCEDRCGPNADCYKGQEEYCVCLSGYVHTSHEEVFHEMDTGECSDVNECIKNQHNCDPNSQVCINTIGNYTCSCRPGYHLSRVTREVCEDIDECEESEQKKMSLCGSGGSCKNSNGSYWCKCRHGYSNYGNDATPCSELKCDQFNTHSTQSLAGILSLMRNSCVALSGPNSTSSPTAGRHNGTELLQELFKATESLLAPGYQGDGHEVSGLLNTVENAMRLIGPQLKENSTRLVSNQTEVEFALRKGETPPTGELQLSNQNVSLTTDWKTVIGHKTYPGFAMAALVSYTNLEKTLNRFDVPKEQSQNRSVKPNYQIFSKVVSAVVSNPSTEHLDPPVVFTFRHLKEVDPSVDYTMSCVYWKAGPDGSEEEGAWSPEGCRLKLTNHTHTECVCSHLSSFAVLMALYPIPDPFELRLLTWVGLSVSLLCLAVSIATFRFCRSIQGTRNTIHLHLCICLFIADLVFLSGISRVKPQGGCAFVAALLHYFFLGAFFWMLLEGVQLYRMVVLVFNATIRPLYLYTVGYGCPLAIVIISAISRSSGYGTERHCWLSLEHGLIWSFFGPVCLIIILNVFFFIVTVWKLALKFSSINPDLSNLRKVRAFTVTAVAQLCVLGLMWVFGAFIFSGESMVPAYIFTILNSLQGALVFVMHCLLSKQVRDEYANFLSCVSMKPKKKYSEFTSSNPSNSHSHSQVSGSGPNTGESHI